MSRTDEPVSERQIKLFLRDLCDEFEEEEGESIQIAGDLPENVVFLIDEKVKEVFKRAGKDALSEGKKKVSQDVFASWW